MPERTPLLLIVLFAILLPSVAVAARFSRYPSETAEPPLAATHNHDSETEATHQHTRPTPPLPDPVSESAPGSAVDYDAAKAVPAEEPELPPGLLGYALHGRGGVTVEYIYTGEVFTNARGGISTDGATKYLGLADVAVTGRLGEMGLFPGGTVFLLGEDAHGEGLTLDYVGDAQVLSNIDPGRPFTQVSEYWWQRSLVDDLITIRLGKQDANAEFAVVDLGGDFINSSFGMHYSIPMPVWPHPAMGAVGLFQLTEGLAFKIGLFDGAADGRTWGLSGTGDVFSIYEFEQQWTLGQLPGDFHVGMWYHSGDWLDLWDEDVERSGNHGLYLGFDQMLWLESDDAVPQGLGFFFQYAWAAEDVNEVPDFAGAGVVYRGLIPCRDEDVTGLGVAQAVFSDALDTDHPETAVELFHKVQLTPYIVVQPDLQYIASPSGVERDAFVAGLRFEALL